MEERVMARAVNKARTSKKRLVKIIVAKGGSKVMGIYYHKYKDACLRQASSTGLQFLLNS